MLKKVWFQIHWFLGITVGSLLVVVGTSGALLSFEDEILAWLNPGIITVDAREQARLTPGQLIHRLRQQDPARQVATVLLKAAPADAVRVTFVPAPGAAREVRYADPYSGDLLPAARGLAFYEFVDKLHRWLLMPRSMGSWFTGTAAACLLVLALSGLYLRWPRRVTDWRRWLKLDFALTGRPFLWNLHAVLGTWALVTYLVFTISGMYWSFAWVESGIDALAGKVRPPRAAMMSAPPLAPRDRPRAAAPAPLDLGPAWSAFLQTVPAYDNVLVRVPARANQPVNFQYLDANPPHDRARNRMEVSLDGAVRKHERFDASPKAVQFVNSFRPLHTGSYWGLPGRIGMMLGALCLPMFAVTGWMLYLKRRKTNRELKAERRALMTAAGGAPAGGVPMLLVFASQSGRSERIVLGATRLLQASGVLVKAVSMARLDMAQLASTRRALFVVSTFGDGEPPDVARRFAQQLSRATDRALAQLSYGVMALGDSQYASFCGFGRILDLELRNRGGHPMFPVVEMDKEDPLALAQWHRHLEALGAAFTSAAESGAWMEPEAPYQAWRLRQRRLLNPGSQGAPLYQLDFNLADGDMPAWPSGALVDVLPEQATHARRYSIASIPEEGSLRLVVRQAFLPTGEPGLASGWLTEGLALHAPVRMRLVENPGFALIDDDLPCIFIGNGSGIAGLRSHLRERVRRGHRRNWLLFGERSAASDTLYQAELGAWQADGFLPELDRVFSRDAASHPYVQHCLRGRTELLQAWLHEGAVIYVCGSLQGMAAGVDQVLGEVLGEPGLEALIADGRYRRDVY